MEKIDEGKVAKTIKDEDIRFREEYRKEDTKKFKVELADFYCEYISKAICSRFGSPAHDLVAKHDRNLDFQ